MSKERAEFIQHTVNELWPWDSQDVQPELLLFEFGFWQTWREARAGLHLYRNIYNSCLVPSVAECQELEEESGLEQGSRRWGKL
jgi:hypothetical protein